MAIPFEQKIVAIHQPNYFPWLGYFHKIYVSDVFVFHDNVEHSKRYPTRRTRIRKSSEDESPIWLTVPLKQHSDFALIKDLEIDHSQNWPEKHIQKLKNTYHRAFFFDQYFEKLEGWYAEAVRFQFLVEWNIYLIKNLMIWIDLESKIVRSSSLPIQGKAAEYNIALVGYLGGNRYVSGSGGSNYQDEIMFSQAGIELYYSQFGTYFKEKHPEMPIGLSILDALFHLGINDLKSVLSLCPKK